MMKKLGLILVTLILAVSCCVGAFADREPEVYATGNFECDYLRNGTVRVKGSKTALAQSIQVINVDATSWIVSKKDPSRYAPQRMLDGAETTSFQFSTNDVALGREYMIFDFAAPSDLDAIWMKNGFWRIIDGLDQYTRNSRIHEMTVEYLYAGEENFRDAEVVTLPDDRLRQGWTVIDLERKYNVHSVRIRVDSIYRGSKFPTDVCVSEMLFLSELDSQAAVGLYGLAIDKLATRTGPSPRYEGGKTYSVKGQYIQVLSRAFDSGNGIWWVKCVIPYGDEKRILWTGYKRFDPNTLPLEWIPLDPDYN